MLRGWRVQQRHVPQWLLLRQCRWDGVHVLCQRHRRQPGRQQLLGVPGRLLREQLRVRPSTPAEAGRALLCDASVPTRRPVRWRGVLRHWAPGGACQCAFGSGTFNTTSCTACDDTMFLQKGPGANGTGPAMCLPCSNGCPECSGPTGAQCSAVGVGTSSVGAERSYRARFGNVQTLQSPTYSIFHATCVCTCTRLARVRVCTS